MEILLNDIVNGKAAATPPDALHLVEESETQDEASHEDAPTWDRAETSWYANMVPSTDILQAPVAAIKDWALTEDSWAAENEMFVEIGKIYNKLDAEYFDFILDKIVHDYNDFFLNDEFYYDGYWHDEEWISTK